MLKEITKRKFTGLIVLLGVMAGNSSAAKSETGADAKTIKATLTKVQETRRVKLASQKKDENSFEFNKAGLELTFVIDPPKGKQIQRLDQPTSITATDSTGRDLSDIEPSIMSRKEFVTLIQTYGAPAEKFTLALAPPARGAENFSVTAQFDVWAFDKVKETTFQGNAKLVGADAKLFGVEQMTAKIVDSRGKAQLQLTPGSVKQTIESIILVSGGSEYQSNSSMWNDAGVTYSFNVPFTADIQVRASVRVGVEKFSCPITINRQTLP